MNLLTTDSDDDSPRSPKAIAEVQFALDHPSLDVSKEGLTDEDWSQLHHDIEVCRQLIEKSGRKPLEVVGAGSFGIVFRCFDERLRRDTAVKVLRPSFHPSSSIRSRFALEAESLAKCDVPGIIRVFESGEFEGIPFIVTQFVEGPNLSEYMHKNGSPLAPRNAAQLMSTIALAIQGMHERAFIHRDLKPSNILLSRLKTETESAIPFEPIVTDFGFVKEIGNASVNHSTINATVGTVRYMAPEQASGQAELLSTKTDIHALGAILFELVTNEPAFSGAARTKVLHKIAHEQSPSIRTRNPRLPRTLDAIISKCLEKQPENRYASASEFAADLQAFLNNEPTIARPVSALRKTWLIAKQNKLLTSSWFLLLGALVTIAVLYQGRVHALREADASLKLTVEALHDIQQQAEAKFNELGGMPVRLELQQVAYDKFMKLAEERNYDAYSRYQLSISCHYLATAESMVERKMDGIAHRRQGIALLERLANEDPKNSKYHFDLFMNYMLLGDALGYRDGHPQYEKACHEIEVVCLGDPDNPTFQDARNAIYMILVRQFRGAGPQQDLARAMQLLDEVMTSSASLATKHPGKPDYGRYVSQGHLALMQIAAGNNEWEEMRRHYQLALDANTKILNAFHHRGDWLSEEWVIRNSMIDTLRRNERYEEMIPEIRAVLPVEESLLKWYPEAVTRKWSHAQTRLWLAIALAKTGQLEEAQKWLEEAKADCEKTPVPEKYEESVGNVQKILREADELLQIQREKGTTPPR